MLTDTAGLDDVLSTTLAKVKLKSLNTMSLRAGGRWAIAFPGVEVLRLYVVVTGDAWLVVDGEEDTPQHLHAGDCLLLPHAKSFVLARDLAIKKRTPLDRLHWSAKEGVISLVCNDGDDLLMVGSNFQLEGHFQRILFGRLPSVLLVPAHAEQATVLRWSLERFAAEVRDQRVGRALMLRHLAPIMLVQTFRGYLDTAKEDKSWFGALADPRLSRAITAMQADCQRSWSLDELSRIAGLSRAGFALNFKRWIGVAPMEYLAQWRMQIACELFQEGERRIAEVANAVGYESESAFSVAFTRIVGCRPGQYRRRGGMAPADSNAPA